MFSGDYLDKNLGHEIINLFKSDNGKCYVYLNDDGKFAGQYKNRVKDMLLVKLGPVPNTLEVIGKAEGLEDVYNPDNDDKTELLRQMEYIIDNKISYGGTDLYAIFAGNEYQYVNITFNAKRVVLVSDKRIILSFDNKYIHNVNDVVYSITSKEVMRRSLREYFDSEVNNQEKDYTTLRKILDDVSLWGNEIEKIDVQKFMETIFYHRIMHNRHLNNLFK